MAMLATWKLQRHALHAVYRIMATSATGQSG